MKKFFGVDENGGIGGQDRAVQGFVTPNLRF
jgi:hypothetical protein